MSYKQNHLVNIIFQGTFVEFLAFLESKGIDHEVAIPGLIGSNGVIDIKLNIKEDEEPTV